MALRLVSPVCRSSLGRLSARRTTRIKPIVASSFNDDKHHCYFSTDLTSQPFISEKVKDMFERMSVLTKDEVVEVSRVVMERLGLEDEMNDVAPADAADAGQAEAADAAAAKEEEKTHVDLKLMGFDAKSKIKVIKEVRSIAGLGLKEAKELVESAPKVITKGMKKEEAEELKTKLEGIGATIEIS